MSINYLNYLYISCCSMLLISGVLAQDTIPQKPMLPRKDYNRIRSPDQDVSKIPPIQLDETFEEYKQRIAKYNQSKQDIVAKLAKTADNDVSTGYYVITQDEIQALHPEYLTELLDWYSFVNVNQNGLLGNRASLNIDAGGYNNVTILINGIEFIDPTSSTGSYDIGQLPIGFIKEIHIKRGGGVLSNGKLTEGGIIDIITKDNQSGLIDVEQSFNNAADGINSNLGLNTNMYGIKVSLYGSFYKQQGYSLANNISSDDIGGIATYRFDNDGVELYDININLHYDFNDHDFIETFMKTSGVDNQMDMYNNFDDTVVDVEDAVNHKQSLDTYVKYHFLLNNKLTNDIVFTTNNSHASYYQFDEYEINQTDEIIEGKFQSLFYKLGYKYQALDLSVSAALEDYNAVLDEFSLDSGYQANKYIFGFNIREYISNEIMLEQNFSFLNHQKMLSDSTEFERYLNYNFSGIYQFPDIDLLFRGNISKINNTPSIYQLFDSTNGNNNLIAEQVWTINGEFVSDNFSQYYPYMSLNIFYKHFENKFQVVDFEYKNRGSFNSYGFSLSTIYHLNRFTLKPSYTFTHAQDYLTDQTAFIIPQSKLSLQLQWKLTDNFRIVTNSIYKSKVLFEDEQSQQYFNSYLIHNININYLVSDNMELFLKLNNLTNVQYQTNPGYRSIPRGYYFGIKYNMYQ